MSKVIETDNFVMNDNGFSFTVKTELDAYKAALKHQRTKTVDNVVVSEVPNSDDWTVQVTTTFTTVQSWSDDLPDATKKCAIIGCTNTATHTWSGHPTCDDCATPSRKQRMSEPHYIAGK